MFKKLIKGLALLIVITIGVLFVSDFTATNEYEKLDDVDKKMFQELSKAYKEFRENPEKLWNEGYDLNEIPLVLVRVNKDKGMTWSHSYLINVKNANSIFNCKKMNMDESLGLPDVYRLGRMTKESIYNLFPANFWSTDIGGTKVFLFKYHEEMIYKEDPWFAFPSFMIHEAFHEYKQADWTYDREGGDHISDYPYEAEQLALLGIEFDLIDEGLASDDVDEISKDIALLRAYRYKKWPKLINETNSEAIEGTAVYLETMVSNRTGRLSKILIDSKTLKPITYHEAFDTLMSGNFSLNYLERRVAYERGAAICMILDKTDVNWKELMDKPVAEGGKTQYQIMYDYYDIQTFDLEKEVQRIKEARNFDTFLEKATHVLESK